MQKQSLHIFKIGGSTHIPHVQIKKKKVASMIPIILHCLWHANVVKYGQTHKI